MNENIDIIRLEEVNKSTLASKLKTKQLGYTSENISLGFNSSNGIKWYTADGGNASYQSVSIGELTGIGNRNVGVDASGRLIIYGQSGNDIDFSDSNWKFSIDTAVSDPTVGYFKVNNADLSLVTNISYSAIDNDGNDKSPALEFLQDGNSIYFKDNIDPTKYAMYNVTSITNNGNWFDVVVTYVSSGATAFVQDDVANNTFIFELSASSLQNVTDIGATTNNVMSYDTHPTFGGDTQIVDKKYVDDRSGSVGGIGDINKSDGVGGWSNTGIKHLLAGVGGINSILSFGNHDGWISNDIGSVYVDGTDHNKVTTEPTEDNDIATKKYVDDNMSIPTLQSVTQQGNETTIGLSSIESPISYYTDNNKTTYLSIIENGGNANEIVIGYNNQGVTGNALHFDPDTGEVWLETQPSTITDKGIVTKAYGDAHYLGGSGTSLWEEVSGILQPITDPNQLRLGGTFSTGKLDIHVESSVANVELSGLEDVSLALVDANGVYNKVDATKYKHESRDYWIIDTGWYWVVTNDEANAWSGAMAQGSGGRPTPVDGATYQGLNGYYGTILVEDSASGSAEAITTNGKIYASDIIKTSSSLQVGTDIAIGRSPDDDILSIGIDGGGVLGGNALDIRLGLDSGASANLLSIKDSGVLQAPNCEISDITLEKHLTTKEYVDGLVKFELGAMSGNVLDYLNGDYQTHDTSSDIDLADPINMVGGQTATYEITTTSGAKITRGSNELHDGSEDGMFLVTVVCIGNGNFRFTGATKVVS